MALLTCSLVLTRRSFPLRRSSFSAFDVISVFSCSRAAEQKEYPLGLPCLVVDGKATLFDASVINLFLAQKLGTSPAPCHS